MMPHDPDAQLSLPHLDLPLGLRLRQGREQAGMSLTDAAERLRLKLAIVDAMEREDLKALGASVYVRGYYSSYARMLGLPLSLVDAGLARDVLPVAPTLHTTTHISHGRYLFDRYARRAVYVVLTASIVLPVILLATGEHLPDKQAFTTPIDQPIELPQPSRIAGEEMAVALSDADDVNAMGPPRPVDGAQTPAQTTVPTAATRDFPVMASLTPFYQQSAARPEVAAPAPVAGTQDATMQLRFSGDSWVEVTGHGGNRLAYGLMRDGDLRDFRPQDVARISLGNSEAVEVRMNGELMDISAFRRANVARFTVSSDGSLAPAGG